LDPVFVSDFCVARRGSKLWVNYLSPL
jgi:hypothetical protein